MPGITGLADGLPFFVLETSASLTEEPNQYLA
jgi:hypothetical protein